MNLLLTAPLNTTGVTLLLTALLNKTTQQQTQAYGNNVMNGIVRQQHTNVNYTNMHYLHTSAYFNEVCISPIFHALITYTVQFDSGSTQSRITVD